MRVEVRPELLDWARERAGLSVDAIVQRLPKFEQWHGEGVRPTLRQLEQFARPTYTPIGYLFLAEPPVERLPIPDFRTVADTGSRGQALTCSTPSTPANSGSGGSAITPALTGRSRWPSSARRRSRWTSKPWLPTCGPRLASILMNVGGRRPGARQHRASDGLTWLVGYDCGPDKRGAPAAVQVVRSIGKEA